MVNEDRVRDFLAFMCERQRIWHRRFIEEESPPWTENEVMQEYHFCNVHRELDSTTQYLMDEVLSHDDPQDVLFNVVVFRLLNNPKSYETIGGFTPVDEFDVDEAVEQLGVWGQEHTVFSPAYRIPAQRWAGSDSKVENVFYGIIRDDLLEYLSEYTMGVIHADTMGAAHRMLEQLRGIGDFLAYELVIDLNYELLDFSENDFVNVGPGAQRGIELFWPGTTDYEAKIRYFVRAQNRLFDHFNLDFPYWSEKPELTCRDFEHSLCEFNKYWRVIEGGSTRTFDPDDHQEGMDGFV